MHRLYLGFDERVPDPLVGLPDPIFDRGDGHVETVGSHPGVEAHIHSHQRLLRPDEHRSEGVDVDDVGSRLYHVPEVGFDASGQAPAQEQPFVLTRERDREALDILPALKGEDSRGLGYYGLQLTCSLGAKRPEV